MFSVARTAVLRASARPKLTYTITRTIVTLKEHKYTAHATARGPGRNGHVESSDEPGLKLTFSTPKELGGKGEGHNPEQLFAMGYSACLLGAIQLMAGKMGKAEQGKNAAVHTKVHIGPVDRIAGRELGGMGLAVDITVEGVDDDVIQAGHEYCPYSRAMKHGVEVTVKKA